MGLLRDIRNHTGNKDTFDRIVEANMLPYAEDVAKAQGKVVKAQAKAEEIAAEIQLEALNNVRANKPVNDLNRLKEAADNISDPDLRKKAHQAIDNKYINYLSANGITF